MKHGYCIETSVALGLSLVAGVASGADEPLVALEASTGRVVHAAHIYYNLATNEQVVTLLGDGQGLGQSSPAGFGSSGPIWSTLVGNTCVDQGFTTSFFYAADQSGGTTSLATAVTTLDWGDIALDSIVDMVHIDWVVSHGDTDSDSDGIGDGVVGLGGVWAWWDADNGRAEDQSTRLPLISFQFINLPGNVFGPGQLTGYTADIDLAASFSSSLVFEIGDSDGDLQGAALHNANVANEDRDQNGEPDGDLDGDGLFDWSWGVRFVQPGTEDLDGDGQIDGELAPGEIIGMSFGAPAGMAIDNGDGTWTWEIDTTPIDAGTGSEDLFAIYQDGVHMGNFNAGGFSCEPSETGYTPYASFEAQLIGPAGDDGDCRADINGDGSLNFFDITLFLSWFPIYPNCDYNGDGVCNFFDISDFLADIYEGCS